MGQSTSTAQRDAEDATKFDTSVDPKDEKFSDPSWPALPTKCTDKYELLERIGKGAFGWVYKIRDKQTRAIYAAKQLANTANNKKEVQLQALVQDGRVVRVYDTIETSKYLVVVMEYCAGGNLREWIMRNRQHSMIDEKLVLQMLLEICQAAHSCHSRRIIHRDLKPENILLDDRRRVKLADFGVARKLNAASVATSFCGTPPYMAPELFLCLIGGDTTTTDGYDKKCDVWSIGCILFDMANSSDLFVSDLHNMLGKRAAEASSDTVREQTVKDLIEENVPQDFTIIRRLLQLMLVKDPQQRCALTDVLMDEEMSAALENPANGHWTDILHDRDQQQQQQQQQEQQQQQQQQEEEQ